MKIRGKNQRGSASDENELRRTNVICYCPYVLKSTLVKVAALSRGKETCPFLCMLDFIMDYATDCNYWSS